MQAETIDNEDKKESDVAADIRTLPSDCCNHSTMSDDANDCDFVYPHDDDLAENLTKANNVHTSIVHHGGINTTRIPRAVKEGPWEANGLEYKHNVAGSQNTPAQPAPQQLRSAVAYAEQLETPPTALGNIGDAPFVDAEALEVPELQLRNEEIGQLEAVVKQNSRRTKKLYFAAAMAGLLVVSLGSLVGVICANGGCGPAATPPVFSPSEIEQRAEDFSLIADSFNLVQGPINYPPTSNSAEELAMQWIVEEDAFLADFDDVGKVTQRFALAVLFFANGPWNFDTIEDGSTDWMNATDECAWMGVSCLPSTTRVVELNLEGVGATGAIPETLRMLSSLRSLKFGSNSLSGTFPTSLFQLAELRTLDLAFNSFSGFDLESVPLLTKLSYLSVANNGMIMLLPPSLESFPPLATLSLANNLLATNPSLPTSIGALSALTLLDLRSTGIRGSIPSEIGDLKLLRTLSLSACGFEGSIPKTVDQLSSLVLLDLSFNQLTGKIPSMTSLKNLTLFSAPTNSLTGSVPDMSSSTMLESLNLGNNLGLTGQIPDFSQITSLRDLYLQETGLIGTIPEELSQLTELRALSLFTTKLNGTLDNLRTLTNLETLLLFGNSFSGVIPSGIGNFTNLRWLVLSHNDISGRIPSSIFALGNLERFDLGYNRLTGTIPEMASLSNLQLFDVTGSKLSGTVPDFSGLSAALVYLDLGSNELRGTLPATLADLTKLEFVNFDGNRLDGTLDVVSSMATTLDVAWFSNNEFTGTIPSKLSRLSLLSNVDLGHNKLRGTIPGSFSQLTNLAHLFLVNAGLEGTIPAFLGDLSLLQRLLLNVNRFSGSIPTELGKLTNLSILSLRNNTLTGEIPRSISIGATTLAEAYFHNNLLTGDMPLCQGNETSLESLVADCAKVTCPCCTNCCPMAMFDIPSYDTCSS